MPTIQWDTGGGGSVTVRQRGRSFVRRGLITDLTDTSQQTLLSALDTLGVPPLGTGHENFGASVVSSVDAVPVKDTPSAADVFVTYDPIDIANLTDLPAANSTRAVFEFSTVIQEVETNRDVTGNLITVKHTPIIEDPVAGTSTLGTEITQTGTVRVQKPLTRASARRREPRNPLYKSKLFVGTLNSRTFLDEPKRFWLCAAIRGRGNDSSGWEVFYDFVLSADVDPGGRFVSGWDPVVTFIDPDTGTFVADPEEGVGIKRVQVLRTADFRQLTL